MPRVFRERTRIRLASTKCSTKCLNNEDFSRDCIPSVSWPLMRDWRTLLEHNDAKENLRAAGTQRGASKTRWQSERMSQAFSLQSAKRWDEPRPLAWAGMRQTFGLRTGQRPDSYQPRPTAWVHIFEEVISAESASHDPSIHSLLNPAGMWKISKLRTLKQRKRRAPILLESKYACRAACRRDSEPGTPNLLQLRFVIERKFHQAVNAVQV